jgi:hypothetical protein
MKNVIVVANKTATSDELVEALKARASQGATRFTLVVPGAPHSDDHVPCEQRLAEALAHMRAAGLEVTGLIGAPDPAAAVKEVWDPRHYDEVIVSTLPLATSKWLPARLPDRIRQLTEAPVTHVVSQPASEPLLT